MCLAVPMEVVEVTSEREALAALDGSRQPVDVSLIENPRVGDFVVVHAGYAIERLDVDEANARLKMFAELATDNAGS